MPAVESSQPPPPPPPPPQQPQQPQQPQYFQPPPKRPPIESSRLRPRARWYWLSLLPLVIGLVGMAFLIVAAIDAFPEEPERFTAPGGPTERLEEGEDYTIFTSEPEFGTSASPPAPDCEVVSLPGGDRVSLRDAGNTTLTFDGDEFKTQLHLTAPRTGRYEVSCDPSGAFGGQNLAFGERPNLGRFAVIVGSGIASIALGVLLAAVIAIVVALRRHRHKRRLQDEAAAASAG